MGDAMRTTHERERSEFRRSRCESAQKNRQGRSSLPLLLDFPTTRAQSASKAAFFLFFFVAHLGVRRRHISTKGKRKRTHQHARTHARPLAARVVRHDDDDDEKKKKKLSSALSRRQTQTGHLAIRGTGETAKREQVFPGLTRNRG